MINLLPGDVKDGYHYARRNVVLRHWLMLFAAALVGLGVVATIGLVTLQTSINHYNRQIATSQQLFKDENYAGTQAEVQNISNSFKLAVKVLGQEVLFSQLIKQIAAAIPSNANLTGLTINQTQGGIDITAVAPNYNTATQVQVNLADPSNKIFSKADLVSVTCIESSLFRGIHSAISAYSCSYSSKPSVDNSPPTISHR